MKKLLCAVLLLNSAISFAGRPTPKGDTMAQINTVMEKANVGTNILSVRLVDAEKYHYVMEFKNYGDSFCRAQGYLLSLEGRNSTTAAPYYVAKVDQLRRICTINEAVY